ncbi:DGQHR domain-containing protein [Roseomonas indoligenes]|uniref:DGQHR domain-containing protein n=1 Tax=Roseomonas indoligenes TaxID=2820811 RepID=A0A940S758_9PROT|nr:DGQHR domain-containing protein [Pararoseomonas indoligenes]MBP0496271.1 DGQHR domain-containing protein [Pararoseomonas indoligenes]
MTEYNYDAFVFHQRADGRGPELAMFLAPAAEVEAWSDVDRLGPDNRLAPQREPSRARISSIQRFFNDDPRNTIPTAIVVGLQPMAVEGDGVSRRVRIPPGPYEGPRKPGLIIDGQHRLRGLAAVAPDTLVPVIAILDADDLEMAFQFLVINNKSARVPRDHLRALALNFPSDQLEARLKTARLSLNPNLGSVGVLDEDEGSPFRGMVAWLNNHENSRIVVPSAIEAMAAEARSMGFPELSENSDVLNSFLIAMWAEVRSVWGELFVADSKLLSKVGLTCLTHFICITMRTWARNPRLRSQVNVGDPDMVRTNTRDVLTTLDSTFFVAEWRSSSYDTRAGRDLVVNDLETMSSNIAAQKPWYRGLQVVDRSWLDDWLRERGETIQASMDEDEP